MASHHSMPPASPREVALRAVRTADVPLFHAFELDPAWTAMAMVKPRSAAVFNAVWAKIFQDWAAGVPGVVQKTILADGQVCGTIGCRLVNERWEFGYGLGRAYWGRGIASRAVALLLAEGGWTPARPIHATCAATNVASIRVLEKNSVVLTEKRSAPETERCLARDEVRLLLQ